MAGPRAVNEEDEDDELLGRTIAGKLHVKEVLSHGAMGIVYRATHLALGHDVAVKVLHQELARDRRAIDRFHREAQTTSRLNHPSSVRILDFGEDEGGLLYLAMELLEGRSLLEAIEEDSPFSRERVVHIATQVLSALAVAHELGILHRDLKPENIMILHGSSRDGRTYESVKVCDFGIAKLIDEHNFVHATLTRQGTIIGTPEYLSPEQGKGELLDARSDLYSMGVILFHMLTRRLPFSESSSVATILKHIHADPPDPMQLAPHADPGLCRVALRAMKKEPAERYENARAMLTELRGSPTTP